MINDRINDRINDLDKAIIDIIKSNKYVTISEITNETAKSSSTINRHLDAMVKRGTISRIGSRKSGYWRVNE